MNTLRATLTFMICCGVLVGGCGPRSAIRAGNAQRGVRLCIGLDASGSARQSLGAYALLSGQLAGRLHEGDDVLSLYRVDKETVGFSCKPATGGMDETISTIAANVRAMPAHSCTLPARFWTEMADEAARASCPMVVILFSDGDNDDQTAASVAAIRTAARRLAQCPWVRSVIVCGVEASNWHTLCVCFEPMRERFHLYNRAEMDIQSLADQVQLARE